MADPRRHVGAKGEEEAAAFLQRNGFRLLERNARTRYGELDLVAVDGTALVFVEVKALRGRGAEHAARALESLGPRKRLQVRRLARAWLADRRPSGSYAEIRFDAVGVAVGPSSTDIVHIRAAF